MITADLLESYAYAVESEFERDDIAAALRAHAAAIREKTNEHAQNI